MNTKELKAHMTNALTNIFDSLNGDDDDTRYDVNIVEEYITHLEKQRASSDEVAMTLCYFATEVIDQLPETCGDLFGLGEDDFIMALYPYAKLIVSMTDEAHESGRNFKYVFVYEAMAELAEFFIAAVLRQEITICAAMAYELPEIDEFALDVARVIEAHTDSQ